MLFPLSAQLLFATIRAQMRSFFFMMTLMPMLAGTAWADASVEGTVQLPPARYAPVMTQRYEVVSRGGVLATNPPLAVVYLEGAGAPKGTPPKRQVVQKNMSFEPTLLAIPEGTTVEFPNEDDTYHNIFSYSPTKRFDLGRYRRNERPIPSVKFDEPGLVTLRCDIHEHMRGLVLVLNTPYFVTTDTDGHFRLRGLPAGKFVLKAWLDSRTTFSHPVELKDGETLHVEFP